MDYAQKREEQFMLIKGGKGYTTADIEALPEGERAELIDGEMFRMDTPTTTHQSILTKLLVEVELYIRSNKGRCQVIPAPYGVYIKKDNLNFVEPDISVICDSEKIDNKGCHGAPDWAVEIVSPSSRKMDYSRKTALYQEAGVREYWIVDPEERAVIVNDFGNSCEAARYSFADRIPVGIYEDFYICVSELGIYGIN